MSIDVEGIDETTTHTLQCTPLPVSCDQEDHGERIPGECPDWLYKSRCSDRLPIDSIHMIEYGVYVALKIASNAYSNETQMYMERTIDEGETKD